MTRKNKKLTLGIKIASILTCLAMTAIGFAAWIVVTLPEGPEAVQGSFEIYTVDTADVTVTPSETNTLETIKFGKDPSATAKWFFAPNVDDEVLSADFAFTVDVDSDELTLDNVLSAIEVTFTPTSAMKAKFDAAITAKYITAPTLTYTYGSGENLKTGTATYDATEGTAKLTINPPATGTTVDVTVTVAFGWGEAFKATIGEVTKNWNPLVYFNNLEYSDTNATAAETALVAISELTVADTVADGVTTTVNPEFSITVEAKGN